MAAEALFDQLAIGKLLFYRESLMDKFGPAPEKLELNRTGKHLTPQELAKVSAIK
jgi:hypothetical protein